MLALPSPEDGPEAYAGKEDARLSPFFKALARELGGSPGRAITKTSEVVKKRWAKTRMRQLFQLTCDQFEATLVECGGDSNWRPLIEDTAAMSFQRIERPDAAKQIANYSNSYKTGIMEGFGPVSVQRENTLTDELGMNKVRRIRVPESVFAVSNVTNSAHYILKQEEVTLLGNQCVAWVFCKTGKLNTGNRFVRHIAAQFKARFPRISTKEGVDTNWENYFLNKFKTCNRRDAHVSL
jgi:hypothetical protein